MTVARVSQSVAEVLRTNTAVKARVSQAVAEVLRIPNNTIRVSQAVIEVLRVNGASTPLTTVQPLQLVIAT